MVQCLPPCLSLYGAFLALHGAQARQPTPAWGALRLPAPLWISVPFGRTIQRLAPGLRAASLRSAFRAPAVDPGGALGRSTPPLERLCANFATGVVT